MVELTIPFVNNGKPFVVGKINFGIIYDITQKGSEGLPETVEEMAQGLILVTGILKQADKTVTEQKVRDEMGVEEFAETMAAILEANESFFEDKVDFQELDSLLKKHRKGDSTS